MTKFGKVQKAAAEVLLLAASAAGVHSIVCMDQKQISGHVTADKAVFVGKGTPAPIVVKFAEELARGTKDKSRAM